MRRAFLVVGPGGSGNRLIGAILVRAGCWGEGSTNQPLSVDDLPSDPKDIVWIHTPNLKRTIPSLRGIGFTEIILIIIIREPEANVRSMVNMGFHRTLEEAYKDRSETVREAVNIGYEFACKVEIITYEGLSTPMLKIWLSRFGLRNDNLDEPLNLVGQEIADHISNQNAKHYVAF